MGQNCRNITKRKKSLPVFISRIPGKSNLGDEIGIYLIRNLTSEKIQPFTPIYSKNRKGIMSKMVSFLLTAFKNGLKQTFINLNSFYSTHIIALGSVINQANKNSVVWGAGIIFENELINLKSKILAVRGPRTLKRLSDLGFNQNIPIGDPAILMPLVYNSERKFLYKYGIIPHISDLSIFKHIELPANILLIRFDTNRIESTIDEIHKCEQIVSSSLHGLIIAGTYGIKSSWVSFSNNLAGDGIKFTDYFESVEIYNVFKAHKIESVDLIQESYLKNLKFILPERKIISNIQKDLLKIAPFKINLEKLKHSNEI